MSGPAIADRLREASAYHGDHTSDAMEDAADLIVDLLQAAETIRAFHDYVFPFGQPLTVKGKAIDHTLLNSANELAERAIAKAEGR